MTSTTRVVSEASLGHIVQLLAAGGYTAEKAAVRRIQRAEDPPATVERVLGALPEGTITVTADHVEAVIEPSRSSAFPRVEILTDMTGQSTGTGEYEDFLALFRDRYDRLRAMLTDRISPRSAASLVDAPQRHTVGVIGMLSDIRSTRNGHMLELEDRTGSCRAFVNGDRDANTAVDNLLLDEVIGVEGTLSDDGQVVFVDTLYQPDVPITNGANRADRPVEAALVSDLHVGSTEFAEEAWRSFARWLDSPDADGIEYLVIAGDMVDGVGVYPGQSSELDIVDVYEQYGAFSEHLKAVPGDIEIVVIPGNHDVVRRAEPQPGFDGALRPVLEAHDATVLSNPSMVELEGVSVLLYHGTSLDEVIAQIPALSYSRPDHAMAELLKKRHLAPTFGNRTRIAPESRDHLVIEAVPDVFHAGHTHTLGVSAYRDVRLVNSGSFQHQTAFQRKVGIDPDVGIAAILELHTLEVTVRSFV